MLLALRCGRLLVQLQLPALLLCFARSSEQHCATSPRGGHCWAAALHVQSMSVWVCVGTCTHPCCAWAPAALVPYCPGLYLRAHSPYPRCTVLQLSTDVSAGFGQPELWLLLVPCQASSPLCHSVRGHPAPGEPGMLTSLHTLNYRQGFNSMVFRPWLRSNIFSCYYPLFTALQNQLMSLHICLEPLLR